MHESYGIDHFQMAILSDLFTILCAKVNIEFQKV